MLICPYCLQENADDAPHCLRCNASLSAIDRCGTCGASVLAFANFCYQCGQALPQSVAAPITARLDETWGHKTASGFLEEVDDIPATTFQAQSARLLHLQSHQFIEFPMGILEVTLGKASRQFLPDIDVHDLPGAKVVSRKHACIHIQGKSFSIEDLGSTNGTFINEVALPQGSRHPLQFGDRISFGQGDEFTLVFVRDTPVNVKHLQDVSGADPAFEQELLQSFVTYAPECIAAIKAAASQQNFLDVSNQAEQLRIASYNVGVQVIQLLSEQLNVAVKQSNYTHINPLIQNMEQEIQKVNLFLKVYYG
ncbi:FHA domain-containing protein [Synechococcales cyanobacterium C]|uniref:FHA domain-containing protein n=1 Tax=Petrachloros mirabilis ULC683 TaxID=2781853 RepID=A0A8K1ZWS5_9CYAN|nr:FHA domain-containing protein [Petrachloros mirabilis]NCJ05303.1 FHA domain-containing protein [Petrachloros mirabilis ULC683]